MAAHQAPRPWDSPGKNTGVGCHFFLQCMKVKNESEVIQSCPTLSDPIYAAYQAPPSMGFSRQEYWSGVPLPSVLSIGLIIGHMFLDLLDPEDLDISLGKITNISNKTYVAAAAKSLQSCLTLCDPRDSSPPGSPIPGLLQARTLEWVVISFSKNMLLGSRAKFRSPKTIAFKKVQLHICLMTES